MSLYDLVCVKLQIQYVKAGENIYTFAPIFIVSN